MGHLLVQLGVAAFSVPLTLDSLAAAGFDVDTRNHARAVLQRDFPSELDAFCHEVGQFCIDPAELIRGGGGESSFTQRLRKMLTEIGWHKRNVRIRKVVNGNEREAETHEIDHFFTAPNGGLAAEIEWNNKDPFFNRDLETFRQLHAENVLSVGIIVTRGKSLQDGMEGIIRREAERRGCLDYPSLIREFDLHPTVRQRKVVEDRMSRGGEFLPVWSHGFVGDKYGAATTHWGKLLPRVERGAGHPCPLLLLGLPPSIVREP